MNAMLPEVFRLCRTYSVLQASFQTADRFLFLRTGTEEEQNRMCWTQTEPASFSVCHPPYDTHVLEISKTFSSVRGYVNLHLSHSEEIVQDVLFSDKLETGKPWNLVYQDITQFGVCCLFYVNIQEQLYLLSLLSQHTKPLNRTSLKKSTTKCVSVFVRCSMYVYIYLL